MTLAQEEWRPVLGYEGLYEVSDRGNVRSVDRETLCADGKRQRYRGRILSPKRDGHGRQFVNLSKQGRTQLRPVAVLVLEAFTGPRPGDAFGCHNDGDPANNRAVNLRWDTASANIRDSVQHGTHKEARKTHCPRRHVLAPPNLVAAGLKEGRRRCLACQRAGTAKRTARLRGEAFDMQAAADDRYKAIMRTA